MATISVHPGMTDSKMICAGEYIGMTSGDFRELAAHRAKKAITDRAEWRAYERRWRREGKLPQPGWWGETGDET